MFAVKPEAIHIYISAEERLTNAEQHEFSQYASSLELHRKHRRCFSASSDFLNVNFSAATPCDADLPKKKKKRGSGGK